MTTLRSPPLTQAQSNQHFAERYEQLINEDGFMPWTESRFRFLPLVILFIYLSLPRSIDSWALRRFTWWAVFMSSVYLVVYTRAKNPSLTALIGLASSYFVYLATSHLLANNAKKDYQRIAKEVTEQDGKEVSHRYYWESFPSKLGNRFFWSFQLIFAITGLGWNFISRATVDLPKSVQTSLQQESDGSKDHQSPSTELKSDQQDPHSDEILTTQQCLRHHQRKLLFNYIVLDIFKTLSSLDPYFLGVVDYPAPPYLPSFPQNSRLLVRIVRMTVAQISIVFAVDTVLRLRPVVYLSLHELHQRLGIPTPGSALKHQGVTSEAWFWPESFGSYTNVGVYGLTGFWSRFWHQAFRMPLDATCTYLLSYLTSFGIDLGPSNRALLRMWIVFTLSGIMHACISQTALGTTQPLSGALMFFFLQPAGIMVQSYFYSFLRYIGWLPEFNDKSSYTCWQRQLYHYAFVNIWLLLVSPLLVEDLAKGGQFHFEPVPFSVLRGLGFGHKDDSFVCWTAPYIE
jgi:hypothetical protein